jgi:type IV secretory pathway protease TraF
MRRLVGWIIVLEVFHAGCLYVGVHTMVNLTPSMPQGFYWRLGRADAVQRGDLVEMSVPDSVLPYLGELPASVHLLKQVVGQAGDTVCWQGEGLTVNGRLLAALPPALTTAEPVGACRVLDQDEVVVLGSHPQSCDSRTLGPMARRRLLYRVVPLWTWGTP